MSGTEHRKVSHADGLAEIADHTVRAAFQQVPKAIAIGWTALRALILEVAEQDPQIAPVSEELRWGQPSYLTQSGSTIRLGWKPTAPEQYCLLFNCQSKLVPTFREIYANEFQFSGNRAIVFAANQPIAVEPLTHCIELALRYKQLRQMPLLGA